MKTVVALKWFFRKNLMVCVLLMMPVLLVACTGMHMIPKEGRPLIGAKSNKAVLVIIRTTSFGWGNVVNNYLDGKMIGQTQKKVFFITEVSPGVHFLISRADNTDTARLNFEAGKIYLVQQGIYPGWRVTTAYSPMTVQDFQKEEQEANYMVYDTQHPGENMSEKDYREAKNDYEREVKEGKHRDMIQYKGYHKLK